MTDQTARDRIIEPPQPEHTCNLPWKSGGYGSTGQADGTLFTCARCGQSWISRPCYESFGNTSRWHRVRWWNWRLRKRIAAAAVSSLQEKQ